MGNGAGFKGYIGLAPQISPGVMASTSSAFWLPFISETLTEEIPRLDSAELRLSADEPYSHQGMRVLAGDIVLEPTPFTMAVVSYLTMGAITTTSNAAYNFHAVNGSGDDWDDKFSVPAFSAMIARDVGSAIYALDCCVNALTLEIANGELLKATVSIIGGQGRGNSDVVSVVSFAEGGDKQLPWNACSLQLQGAAPDYIKSATVSINNNLEQTGVLDGEVYPTRIKRAGFRTFGVEADMVYESMAVYNTFRANTIAAFKLSMFTDSSHFIVICHGALNYTSHPANLSGPGAAAATVGLKGHGDRVTIVSKTGVVLRVGSGDID